MPAKNTIPRSKQRVFATKEQEEELRQILLSAGYPIEDIDIKVDGVRVGYWNEVSQEVSYKMNKVIQIDPFETWDDDTGDKWFYSYDQEPDKYPHGVPIGDLRVTNDDFPLFLNYLFLKRKFTTLDIIHVVEKPHRYYEYYGDYNKENVE